MRFSERLKSEMENKGYGPINLQEVLINHGIDDISNKRISEYLRQISTPSFEKARSIFDVLEAEVSNDELREMLRSNREFVRQGKEENNLSASTYRKEIVAHIKVRNLLPKLSPINTEALLNERVDELFGGSGPKELSRYTERLIMEDLQKRYGKKNIKGAATLREETSGKKRTLGNEIYRKGTVFELLSKGENK